jgi:predicted DNA-binding protein with PD1-like motif
VKAKRVGGNGQTTHVLVFEKGDEVVDQLRAFPQQEHLTAASFTAIGAFSDVTLGFFERDRCAEALAGEIVQPALELLEPPRHALLALRRARPQPPLRVFPREPGSN